MNKFRFLALFAAISAFNVDFQHNRTSFDIHLTSQQHREKHYL